MWRGSLAVVLRPTFSPCSSLVCLFLTWTRAKVVTWFSAFPDLRLAREIHTMGHRGSTGNSQSHPHMVLLIAYPLSLLLSTMTGHSDTTSDHVLCAFAQSPWCLLLLSEETDSIRPEHFQMIPVPWPPVTLLGCSSAYGQPLFVL